MADKNLFYPLWQKYLPVITLQLKNAVNGVKEIKIPKSEFDLFGSKKVADYIFNLEVKNGKVLNSIGSKGVVRDLVDIIQKSPTCMEKK